jgi:hypothetical protein
VENPYAEHDQNWSLFHRHERVWIGFGLTFDYNLGPYFECLAKPMKVTASVILSKSMRDKLRCKLTPVILGQIKNSGGK